MSRLARLREEMLYKVAVVGLTPPLNMASSAFSTPYSNMYMQNLRTQQLLMERSKKQRDDAIQQVLGGPNNVLATESQSYTKPRETSGPKTPTTTPSATMAGPTKLDALRNTLRPFTSASVGVPGPRSI